MIAIGNNFSGAFLAFLAGAAIASAGYAVSRYVLKKHETKYLMVQMVKQPVQIAFLVLLYLLGGHTSWDRIWLLAGGCLGITLPMFWFTYRLVKLNDSLHRKEDLTDG